MSHAGIATEAVTARDVMQLDSSTMTLADLSKDRTKYRDSHVLLGTTTMLASLVSAERPDLITQAAVLAELADEQVIAGIHLEGPFLSSRFGAGRKTLPALTPADPETCSPELSRHHAATCAV